MRDSFFRIIVVILLAINTFFIGSIWRALTTQACGMKKSIFCPFGKQSSGKICPITGKVLQSGMDTGIKGTVPQ